MDQKGAPKLAVSLERKESKMKPRSLTGFWFPAEEPLLVEIGQNNVLGSFQIIRPNTVGAWTQREKEGLDTRALRQESPPTFNGNLNSRPTKSKLNIKPGRARKVREKGAEQKKQRFEQSIHRDLGERGEEKNKSKNGGSHWGR